MPLRILFVGTGTFAQPALEALLASSHQVVGLVTQPDRGGTGKHQHPHPLKELALARGLEVFQPANVNTEESLARLKEFAADLFVVAAYGQILKMPFLAIPRLGAINIHASLLPRHRGAAPINFSILAGDAETGVSIFQIEPKLDSGPVWGMISTPIGAKETAGQLEDRLSALGAGLVTQVVDQMDQGTATSQVQDSSFVTLAPKMPKAFGLVDWTKDAAFIERQVRALQPWPTAYSFLHVQGQPPQRIVLIDVDPLDEAASGETHGIVIGHAAAPLVVQTGTGPLAIRKLQPAGKRAMTADDFLRGRPTPPGSSFGPEQA
ncbi:Methionyl-tRNA formyltransferase [Caulifigura coniformis]|uniref:Methionyl-tRNA formyltransferase n=1 Tax=Caulifigura coniformis TaxID=2527983 RepID=A0A517SM89_9PLAN|nr:methionyl-tRNA formyltransferase [Caulifigura coniformis]QDT57241.1 Methionyl-tRNA formyltransferase [Caulifigura coniformis]